MQLLCLSLTAVLVAAASLPLNTQEEEQEGLAASLSALKPKPAKKWNIPPLQTKVQQSSHGSVSKDGRLVGSIGHNVEASKLPGESPLSSSSTEVEEADAETAA